jgi:hypothetical protein
VKLWPAFEVDPSDPKHVVEKWSKTGDDRNPEVIACCENPINSVRVRDGLELMSIAEPESWWEKDSTSRTHPWTERSINLMRALMADFLPVVERVSDAYIEAIGEEGDWFEGITEINSDSISVRYSVRGCGRGCCPDYDVSHDIPLRAFWDLDGLLKEIAEAKCQRETEKKRKEEEEARKKAEEARIAQEKRDKAEFERLKAKYEGAAHV